MHTYIPISPPSCVSFPPSLSHSSRWSQSTEVISQCNEAASHQLSILHLVVYICQRHSLTLSQLTLPPPRVLKSILYVCTSASLFLSWPQVLQNHIYIYIYIYSDSINMCQHTVFVFCFLTYFTLCDTLQAHPSHYK